MESILELAEQFQHELPDGKVHLVTGRVHPSAGCPYFELHPDNIKAYPFSGIVEANLVTLNIGLARTEGTMVEGQQYRKGYVLCGGN